MTTDPVDLERRVSDLVASRSAGEAVLVEFGVWWTERAPEAGRLLDALAERARTDPAALRALLALVDRHGIARPALHRLLVTPQDVDDAEQATLAVVGLKVGDFDGRSKFTTWLHTVAENEAKMLIRARARRPAAPTAEVEPAPFLARLSTLVANRDVVERALAELPEDFRRPLELREIGRLDYDEIAAELGVPIGTVRSRLHRARALLVDALATPSE